MPKIDTTDRTFCINTGGTWISYATIAEELDVSDDDVLHALDDIDIDVIMDDVVDFAYGEIKRHVAEQLKTTDQSKPTS